VQTCGPWRREALAATAGRFLEAGTPVAAIFGATAGLARAGLRDDRNHTSASAEYLAATDDAGGDRYVDERAVIDGDVITAGPQSPVHFARAAASSSRALVIIGSSWLKSLVSTVTSAAITILPSATTAWAL
jgi:putative intracellular protease/amidase